MSPRLHIAPLSCIVCAPLRHRQPSASHSPHPTPTPTPTPTLHHLHIQRAFIAAHILSNPTQTPNHHCLSLSSSTKTTHPDAGVPLLYQSLAPHSCPPPSPWSPSFQVQPQHDHRHGRLPSRHDSATDPRSELVCSTVSACTKTRKAASNFALASHPTRWSISPHTTFAAVRSASAPALARPCLFQHPRASAAV